MTAPSSDPAPHAPGTPPPGCPAHAGGQPVGRRLYTEDAIRNPRAVYEELREQHGAVAPVLLHGDLPAWLVLGYRENLKALQTPSVFSRDSRYWRDMEEGRVPSDHPLIPITAWQPLCVFVDGEKHRRLRGAVTESLDAFESRGIRLHVTQHTDRLVDEFAEAGQADLVGQFAAQLPLRVMTQLYGMSDEHGGEYGPAFIEAVQDALRGTATSAASNDFVTRTLDDLVARKQDTPAHDLPSMLLAHPAGLSTDEVREHLRLILTAANETTVNLLANTLHMVLTDSRFRADLAGGHMTLPDGLEQVMWDEPPMMTLLGRWAARDTALGEQRIRAGDLLLLGLAAGNVDSAVRDEDTPVIGNRSHLAFSRGPHECPGQQIARAIAESAIDALLRRLPDLRLAVPEEELRWSSALMYRNLAALPVEFSPVSRKLPVLDADAAGTLRAKLPSAVAAAPAAQGPGAGAGGPAADRKRAPWWKPWAHQS
ncbi:cytochrome [Streptomyces qinglanensis]|uniref:Cytochrome n=1 Tax=Streptomyces qinglanensis TaxID=943816 RepID=A0A1E7K534_9ACTN|nr:cytochrome P450 [Streptomyces qinglanensis]OEU99019.1 cytochrome [Streptomyces qinglanensis]